MCMTQPYDVLALFSGGLDSVLACKVMEDQGLKVLNLHYHGPFFGHPELVDHWRETFDMDIVAVDVGQKYLQMMLDGPRYGLGKTLNPCVDCKIFMIAHTRELLSHYGARFIISGEVLGQRPMSQRKDALNSVKRDSGAADVLLRPLCARNLPPTPMEESGLVDRERLLDISGRGRKRQLELAVHYGLKEIPTPAGGCRLTDVESCRRFYPVFRHFPQATAEDFDLANLGRQAWSENGDEPHWLIIGRNQEDNEALEAAVKPDDILFCLRDYPGPFVIGRQFSGAPWDEETVKDAAMFAASFSPKAVKAEADVVMELRGARNEDILIRPNRTTAKEWGLPVWDAITEGKPELSIYGTGPA